MRVSSRARRSAFVFSSLLLVALVVLTGCPDDSGGGNGGNGGNGGGDPTPPDTTPPDTTPPAQSVSVSDLSVENETNLLFTLVNPNDEEVRVGVTLSPDAPAGTMIEFDGNAVVFTDAVRIALAATGDVNNTKQIRITGVASGTEYTLTATTFDTTGNAQSVTASDMATTTLSVPSNFVATGRNGQVTLTWTSVTGADEYYIYRAIAGGAAEQIAMGETITATTYIDENLTNGTEYTYTVRAVNSNGESELSVAESAIPRTDSDGDLLIDIFFLEELNNVRNNLAGTAYRTSSSGSALQCGTAGDTECRGYELMRSLDFADEDSYAGGINNDWHPDNADPDLANNAGWIPLGDDSQSITFEGNGNTISNLYVRANTYGGLFGRIFNSTIRNLGVIDGRIYGGDGADFVGGLAGLMDGGIIIASYATGGTVDGGAGSDEVGGLVGNSTSGSSIVASYATGTVDGGADSDRVGGLVGETDRATVIASYATGTVDGGADNGNVGGLVGRLSDSTLTASYATGTVDGSADSADRAGGLVGRQSRSASITASYATGNVDGGAGNSDLVGRLVGERVSGPTTASYGFGMQAGGETAGISPTLPTDVSSADGLTLENVDDDSSDSVNPWDDAGSSTLNVWNFETGKIPAVQYADYDGSGTDYACATASSPPSGAILIPGANCASGELVPGQR